MTATSLSIPLPPTTLTAGKRWGALELMLRPSCDADIGALLEITPDDTLKYFLAWPTEWTLSGFSAWFHKHRKNPKTHVFVVVLGGAVAGSTSYLDVDPANRAIEIG